MATVPSNTITAVTRRDVRRAIIRESIWWAGDLDEVDFLGRLYNLASLPSTDNRFDDAAGDIWQHRLNNHDWNDYWVFDDDRFQLTDGPDDVYVNFLAEMVHPVVRPERDQADRIVAMFNELLAPDRWKLVVRSTISGRPIFASERLAGSLHAVEAAKSMAEVIDEDYIHRQVNRMTAAIELDPDLAIGTAKELIESVCYTILVERGKPAEGKPDLLPLVRLTLSELSLIPEKVADEAKGAKSIRSLLGNLAVIAQSMAEIRNLYGTGHGKHGGQRGLAARHARLAVGAATTLTVFLFETHLERSGDAQSRR